MGQGADLEPGTLLAAYRCGLFPMPIAAPGPVLWWSPARRGVLPLGELKVSKSLRKSCRRYQTRVDSAFGEVIRACACVQRPGGWISPELIEAYERLHELGWVHSVETWTLDGSLVGGLYGVAVGGLFAGESMFHRERDASKVALVSLVRMLGGRDGAAEGRLLDVQWTTPHLESLGAIELDRRDYLDRLAGAVALPVPRGLRTETVDAAG